MIFVWIGLAVLAGVLLMAARRPILARLGFRYAAQRPRQTALIVAGLMITTTVLAAAGIAADSSGASYRESVLGRLHFADAAVWSDEFWGASMEDAIRSHPQLRGAVEDTSAAIRTTLPVEGTQTARGDSRGVVWGIDPASFAAIARLEPTRGTVPATLAGWQEGGAIVNRAMALQLGVAEGDAVTVYVPQDEVDAVGARAFNGTLSATLAVPGPSPYVHGPNDVYTWTLDVPPGTSYFEAFAEPTSDVVLVVEAVSPTGATYEGRTSAEQPATVNVDESMDVLEGNWTLSVHSPAAVNAEFTLVARWHHVQLVEATTIDATVLTIVQDKGADPLGFGPAIFLPLPQAQAALDQPGRVNTILLSVRDDVDAEAFDEIFAPAVQEAWRGEIESSLNDVAQSDRRFVSPRAEFIRFELERVGAQIEEGMRVTFLSIGSFTIVAGFLLVGVLMALLVEERKRVLAALRAIGGQRGHVTAMHVHEGAGYAALAVLAGLVAGGVLATMMTSATRSTFAAEGGSVVMVFRWDTIATAVATGFGLTVLVVALAAWWTSRIPIAAALRGEAGDARQGRTLALVLFGLVTLVGGLITADAAASLAPVQLVLGPCLLLVGLAGIVSRFVDRNVVFSAAGLLVVVYVVLSFEFASPRNEVEALVIPIRVVLLALAAAIVAGYFAPLHRLLALLAQRVRGLGGVADTAFAHLRHRPGRAAMTMAILGTVLMVLTALGTLFASFAPADMTNAGGYTVLGDVFAEIDDPAAYLQANPPRSGADPLAISAAYAATPWRSDAANFRVSKDGFNGSTTSLNFMFGSDLVGVTQRFADTTSWRAREIDGAYPDVRAALLAVANDPGLVVVSDGLVKFYFRGPNDGAGDPPPQEALRAGEVVRVGSNPEAPTLRVIAVLHSVGTAGAFVHPSLLEEMSGSGAVGTRIWARPVAGVTDARLASELEAAFRSIGLQAVAVKDAQLEAQREIKTVQAIISVFLWLGIVIGLVALALVTTRNVLLRRQEVGVLRALGGQRAHVMAAFGLETLYVAGVAIAMGLGGGLLLARSVLSGDNFGTLYSVDWGGLAMLYAMTLLAAIGAAAWPAWRASRMPPAEAVRHAE